MHFYGYLWELPDGRSGHCALKRILGCDDIDILSSPVGYLDRMEGGLMQFMSPVDSVLMAGKLWMVEDDTRTHLATDTGSQDEGFNFKVKTPQGTYGIHKRNIASIAVRGAGLWWMDLWSNGWLGTKDVWDNIETAKNFYDQYTRHMSLKRPEVGIIGDEDGVKSFYNSCCHGMLIMQKNQGAIYKSGLDFGLYLIDDLMAGKLDHCKLLVILGAYYLDEEKKEKIKKAVYGKGKTVLWVYGVDTAKGEFISELMGINVILRNGMNTSEIITNNAIREGEPFKIDTTYSVHDPKAVSLGKYADSEDCGFAMKEIDNTTTIFYGGLTFSPDLLRQIATIACVHIFSRANDVTLCNDDCITSYATERGEKTFYLPRSANVYAQNGDLLSEKVTEFKTVIDKHDAKYFTYR